MPTGPHIDGLHAALARLTAVLDAHDARHAAAADQAVKAATQAATASLDPTAGQNGQDQTGGAK